MKYDNAQDYGDERWLVWILQTIGFILTGVFAVIALACFNAVSAPTGFLSFIPLGIYLVIVTIIELRSYKHWKRRNHQ